MSSIGWENWNTGWHLDKGSWQGFRDQTVTIGDIADNGLWYDASRKASIVYANNNRQIKEWKDVRGRTSLTQTNAALYMTDHAISETGRNGIKARPDSQLILERNLNLDDMDIFTVLRINAAGCGDGPQWWNACGIYDAEEAGGSQDWGFSVRNDGRLMWGIGPGPAGGDFTITTPIGTSYIGAGTLILNVVRSISPDLMSIYVNGALLAQGVSNRTDTRNNTRVVVGSIQTDIKFIDADYFEIGAWGRVLNESERLDLTYCLGRKWIDPNFQLAA